MRPVKTCFRFGCGAEPLNLASDEQLVGSLCKRHAVTPEGAPTACRRTVSGTISLLCSRCFSPFLRSTGSLSVSQKYLALPDGSGGFRQDLTCPALLRIPLGTACVSCTGLSPAMVRLSRRVPLHILSPHCGPTTPAPPKRNRFGLSPLRSPLLGGSLLVFFSSRYLDVSVPWVCSLCRVTGLQPAGLPHSEIHGSQVIMHLPVAYRSLSRPSSPLRAKASTVRP